jgi:predicted Zn finger-like uncharacterized protein
MIVQCPSCASRYRVNDANVPPSGGKITCPSCQHKFIVYPEQDEQPQQQGGASDLEDKTSVAFRPDLQQLVSKMQGGEGGAQAPAGQEPAGQATEVMSGDHVPEFAEGMVGNDGTVEMKNPFQDGNLPGFGNRKGAEEQADEADVAATEVVSGDMLDGMNFNDPSGGSPSQPQGRGQQSPPSQPQGRGQQSPPSQPPSQPQGRGQQSPPSQPQGRGQKSPPSQPQGRGQKSPPSQPQGRGQQSPPSQPQGRGQKSPPSSSQSSQSLQTPATPAQDAQQGAAGGSAPAMPGGASPGAGPAGPDPNHQGPWKLKTNFGLTYEFPDTAGLKNWLSNREDLDGYELSGDDDTFHALADWPQLGEGSGGGGRRQIPSFEQQNSPPAPQPPSEPSMGLGGGGAAPNPAAAGAGPASSPASQPPAPSAPGKKIEPTEYTPPSRNAGSGVLLWAIFLILALVAAAISVQTFGIFDIKSYVEVELLGREAPQPEPEATAQQETDSDEEAEDDQEAGSEDQDGPDPRVAREVDRLLGDARRAVRNNRLQSASEKLKNAQLLDPERAAVYQMQADVYEQMGQHEEAEKAKERAEQLAASSAGEQEAAEEASTN